MKLTLKNVRLAFPVLFTAQTVNGEGDPAFSASFLLPNDSPQIAEINKAIDQVAKEKWGEKAAGILKTMRGTDKACLHDGDMKAQYGGYEGHQYVSARGKTRPTVIDRDKTPLTAADGKPYSGCYVNAIVELWTQDNNYGKRVNASLAGVQFFKDGEAFAGGAVASADDFEDLGVEEEAFV